ncbi:MAG: efflux RND transporter periplasmic adaptor subunit [Alistipes sp.]|nr:efflux RND transporter periplasmic adaptor subunit [Candidatus Alistipes equi]
MKKINITIATIILIFTVGCTGSPAKINEEIKYHKDSVIIDKNSPILSKLTIEDVHKMPFNNEFRTVGTVQAKTGHYAEVSVPFDGRIINSRVTLGLKVRAAETLFEVSSPEFLETGKTYLQNVQRFSSAKVNYERKKVLHEHGIVSQRELDDAFTEKENARHDKESSEATLRVFGVAPEKLRIGEPMKVVSPINGEIVFNKVTIGSYTKTDAEPLVTIADLNEVWITASVKERFIGNVTKGGKAEIFTEAEPQTPILADIINIGNVVDEQTRSIQVVVCCKNPEMKLKHGMYVAVHFISELKDAVVIPSKAIFQGENFSYVFVQSKEENTFIRRKITLGKSNDTNTLFHVREGLSEKERIITDGGLYLN